MDKPCIVCQENCPVSPKAIFTREVFQAIRSEKALSVQTADRNRIVLAPEGLEPGSFGGGDHFALLADGRRYRIAGNTGEAIEIDAGPAAPDGLAPGSPVVIQVRLQQPYVDPQKCIGCGVCEHECPVLGLRAIRVTAENESRSPGRRMIL
jgi:Pyruvate/2-oxoacid:ferredoxin oxidoreductase delta subunit